MGLMRNLLLWGSRNQALRAALPRFAFLQRGVKRFIPGEDVEDALRAAESLNPAGISAVLTHLGENLMREEEARDVALHYRDALDRIAKRGLDCHISVKPTQLGLDFSAELCSRHLSGIVQRANELSNVVWIDMESSVYVDRTLELYRMMRTQYPNVGLCLQSYLYRTRRDLDALLPLSPSIRLVKGAYAEPRNVAYRRKRLVDESFFTLAVRLLEARRDGMRIGIATHDIPLIERIARQISQRGVGKDAFEVQMLYGIKREEQHRLARAGYRVRVLISYGSFWFPWYMRRLAERPANVLFVLKNIFVK